MKEAEEEKATKERKKGKKKFSFLKKKSVRGLLKFRNKIINFIAILLKACALLLSLSIFFN